MSLISNLVSYWKLDESSGNAVDSVSSNTAVNTSVTYAAGKINNGAVFNGSANLLTSSSSVGAGKWSANFWLKVPSLPGTLWGLIGGDATFCDITINSAGFKAGKCGVGDGNNVAYTININTWYMVTLVVQSTTSADIYVNGVYVGASVYAPGWVLGNHALRFGAASSSGDIPMIGSLDEIGVWSRELTSTEISTLYNSGSGIQYPFFPILTTEAVTNIDLTSATLNGTLTYDGGFTVTEKGFVYSISQNPTIANSKVIVAGSSSGAYTGSVTGLTINTTYYVRSYATNSQGTGYGDQVSFTTITQGAKKLYLDINGIEGETYTVSLNVGGSAGSVSVKLGSTSTAHVINAGAGVTVFSDIYSGLSGLIIESSEGFVGTVDDVFYVLTLGDAVIDWALNSLTNVIAVNSSVTFKRIEDKEITRFNLYRYLDTQFKDLDGYVTVTIAEEKNDLSYSKSKSFLVGNTGTTVSPFVKKRISMLSKNQAILITLSNNKLNETFTICQYSLTGFKEPRKLYKLSKIISI